MEVIKKINNNVALCIDGNGKELIAFGKGIGFPKMPYTLEDLSCIDRTFYSMKRDYIPLFMEADEEVLEVVSEIVDYARNHVHHDISDTLYYVLVDHLNFAISRYRKGEYVSIPFYFNFRYLFDEEADVGTWAIKRVNERFHMELSSNEESVIAMHIVECEEHEEHGRLLQSDFLVEKITEIVERDMKLHINRDGFNYQRFVTHLQFLFKRVSRSEMISSENLKMYEDMNERFPDISHCVNDIHDYLESFYHKSIDEEEKLYLMLHINRLCSREDCNQ